MIHTSRMKPWQSAREQARQNGEKMFNGKPCDKGHGARRYTSAGSCVECYRLRGLEGRRQPREKQNEHCRRHAERHRERMKLAADVDRLLYPEKYAARRKAARLRNGDALRAKERQRRAKQRAEKCPKLRLQETLHTSRRRARKRGVLAKATIKQIRWLKEMQGHRCAYCGNRGPLELDHKIALAKGGPHVLSNLQWLCQPHNKNKMTMPDHAYRRQHGIPLVTPWDWQFRMFEFVA